jgi:hypothetical protein
MQLFGVAWANVRYHCVAGSRSFSLQPFEFEGGGFQKKWLTPSDPLLTYSCTGVSQVRSESRLSITSPSLLR